MELLHKLHLYICKLHASITPAVNQSIVDLSCIEAREEIIQNMIALREKTASLVQFIDDKIQSSKILHAEEIATVGAFMSKIKQTSSPWTVIQRKRPASHSASK